MIRDYLGYDLQFIKHFEIQCYENPWPSEEIQKNTERIFTNVVQMRPVGYLIYDIKRMSVLLLRLGVAPMWRRKGKACELLDYTAYHLRNYRKITTIIPESNLAAANLLKKNDYKCVNAMKDHFTICGQTEDGLYFVRKL